MSSWIDCYRLVTFIPPDKAKKLALDIAPCIPNMGTEYDGVCWYGEAGTEQFRPLEGADPTVGKPGKIEHVASVRLEFTLPKDDKLLDEIIEKHVIPAHPWEKPVILVFQHRLKMV